MINIEKKINQAIWEAMVRAYQEGYRQRCAELNAPPSVEDRNVAQALAQGFATDEVFGRDV